MQRTALVTGAAGGIGRAIVDAFAGAGWRVVAVDKQPLDDISPLARAIRADLALPQAPATIARELERDAQGLDALINNAAIDMCRPLIETSDEDWDRTMAINVRAPFLLARETFHLLKANGGAVVNVSSVHAIATSEGRSAYCASKAALLALTRTMALEFGPSNVRANAVLPGATDTPMLRHSLRPNATGEPSSADALHSLAQKHPLRRVGRPQDIARAVLFLADTTQSAFITGQAIVVDGGATARLSTE